MIDRHKKNRRTELGEHGADQMLRKKNVLMRYIQCLKAGHNKTTYKDIAEEIIETQRSIIDTKKVQSEAIRLEAALNVSMHFITFSPILTNVTCYFHIIENMQQLEKRKLELNHKLQLQENHILVGSGADQQILKTSMFASTTSTASSWCWCLCLSGQRNSLDNNWLRGQCFKLTSKCPRPKNEVQSTQCKSTLRSSHNQVV